MIKGGGGLGRSPKALRRSGVWGKAPMALRRSRGSRGWPLGVINNQIGGFGAQPQGSPQEWGLGQRPNSPLQEQGFKGLAPWCINNHHISYYFLSLHPLTANTNFTPHLHKETI